MSIRLRYVIWLAKTIQQNKVRVVKIFSGIERYKASLSKNLKKLSDQENIEFGYRTGCIDKPEYLIMLTQLENKK